MEDFIINLTSEDVYQNVLDDIKNVCEITFEKLKVVNPIFNIIIVDNDKIREINREYRNKDAITDVISFAFEDVEDIKYDNMRFLGEIYISLDRAKEQAHEYGHSEEREICYLTVHGLLHLLGYDHMIEKDKRIMRALEEDILSEYGAQR